ncbi:3-deoxy-D-manno-octulosonic acid kinase [Ferrimonas aestuarii]|uniref:3-deoxy-D-manno-octulosonic acid kinase n=1 Tax=Ferrimonas aestuarii TaxID=2569539 RepID=A0A4U1BPD6_9GAMM|nr:3-deoxy-D-manno-octulosonic acid kinase [Ferrimonas aestuarii]TKB56275.1 3-deoxy-D-manno-octulosonic acid kinase [Ferrimonas aestuarii]
MQQQAQGKVTLLSADGVQADWRWFDRDWLMQNHHVVGHSSASGRNPAWFLKLDERRAVLRHYYRGGLPGKVIKDWYLWPGLEATRPFKELALLEQLVRLGLPVSKPLAARVERSGLGYRADLITEQLCGCQDLVGALTQGELPKSRWFELGALLRRFHDAGVYHADLNARNILLDENQFFLIDFDRGELRQSEASWQQANLERLKRSLHKEMGRVDGLHWKPEQWQHLMEGYQGKAG